MRRIVKVVFFSFLLPFSSLTTQAQFNVNSLFAPLNIGVTLFHDQPVSAHRSVALNLEHHISTYFDTLNGWKHWSIVENYAYGKDRGDLPMITDLNSLHPFFRDQVVKLMERCKAKGIELAIVETYRTPAKQHEYKRMGKKYTSSGAGQSKHQYGLAVDVVPMVKGVAVWDNALLWRKVGIVGEKLGLRWGGRWRNPYDPGHFEWTGGLASYHLKAGKLPKLPVPLERYPCLDEDIQILRKYWEEWGTSQSAMTRK